MEHMQDTNEQKRGRRWSRRTLILAGLGVAAFVIMATAAVAAWLFTVGVDGTVSSADSAEIEFHHIYTGEVSASQGTTTPVVNPDGTLTIEVDGFTPGAVATGAARFANMSLTTPGDVLAFSLDGADVEVIEFGDTPVGDKALILEWGIYNHSTATTCGPITYDPPLTVPVAGSDSFGDPVLNTDNSRCLKWRVEMTANAAPGTAYDLGTGGLDISSS